MGRGLFVPNAPEEKSWPSLGKACIEGGDTARRYDRALCGPQAAPSLCLDVLGRKHARNVRFCRIFLRPTISNEMDEEEDIDKRLDDVIQQKKEEIERLVRLLESIDIKPTPLPEEGKDESVENAESKPDQ